MYPRIIFLWNGLISLTISLMNDHILLLYRNTFVLIDIFVIFEYVNESFCSINAKNFYVRYVILSVMYDPNVLPIVLFVLLSFWFI